MSKLAPLLGVLLLACCVSNGADAERFVHKLKAASGQTLVVAEGDLEPRSTGSFSVRLYTGSNPDSPTDDFLGGLIVARDGTVEKVLLADIDNDQREELVVIVRSVGTGGYLSAHAFAIGKTGPTLRATVADLAAGADPIAALHRARKPRR